MYWKLLIKITPQLLSKSVLMAPVISWNSQVHDLLALQVLALSWLVGLGTLAVFLYLSYLLGTVVYYLITRPLFMSVPISTLDLLQLMGTQIIKIMFGKKSLK